MTRPLTLAQRAEAAESIALLLQEIASDDLEATAVERAYLEGALRALDAPLPYGGHT